jgi:murein DD-endopeptidase MepM/ murein hydrolase activator NlpD
VVKSSYREGDIIGYIGNSGLCRPAPTPQRPFDGAHLHLMLFKNGILIDPLTVFNPNEWFVFSDTGVDKDAPPLQWALNFVKSQLAKLLAILKK